MIYLTTSTAEPAFVLKKMREIFEEEIRDLFHFFKRN